MKSLVHTSRWWSLAGILLGDLKAEAWLCSLNTLPHSPCHSEAFPDPLPPSLRPRQVTLPECLLQSCCEKKHEAMLGKMICKPRALPGVKEVAGKPGSVVSTAGPESPASIGCPFLPGGSRACWEGAVSQKEALEPRGLLTRSPHLRRRGDHNVYIGPGFESWP